LSAVAEVKSLPPKGHYLAYEVGRLAGVSGSTIGQWARNGYIRSSQYGGSPRLYSFQDVAEAMVVHELVERGIPYREIKSQVLELQAAYGMDWPLTQSPVGLATAGRHVVTTEGERIYATGEKGWHLVLDAGDLKEILGLLDRGGWVVRSLPDLEHIEVNPNRLSGRPAIRGKRVPAEMVARTAERPDGIEALREGFELSDAEINDARRWWQATEEFERVAA
jgi:uncharacterized protein (DUF433 family)/DNA-binding transcriptional MerR regulator